MTTTPARTITVFGKKKLTPDEQVLLEEIGWALYYTNRQLYVAAAEGTSATVAAGYRRAGGTPTIRRAGDASPPDTPTIVVLDAALVLELDDVLPGWDTRGWILISDAKTLTFVHEHLTHHARQRLAGGSGDGDDDALGSSGAQVPIQTPDFPSGPPAHSVAESKPKRSRPRSTSTGKPSRQSSA